MNCTQHSQRRVCLTMPAHPFIIRALQKLAGWVIVFHLMEKVACNSCSRANTCCLHEKQGQNKPRQQKNDQKRSLFNVTQSFWHVNLPINDLRWTGLHCWLSCCLYRVLQIVHLLGSVSVRMFPATIWLFGLFIYVFNHSYIHHINIPSNIPRKHSKWNRT